MGVHRMNLIERLQSLKAPSNDLDVLCEVALFEPDHFYASCRSNAAGTKVIYTTYTGEDHTRWAPDWTEDTVLTIELLHMK